MILLVTNAVVFLLAGHPRGRRLRAHAGRLARSPVSLLEVAFLVECRRTAFADPEPSAVVRADPRWSRDDPPLDALVTHAISLSWTRGPFDRLLCAHAFVRAWRLASSDRAILARLPASATLAR